MATVLKSAAILLLGAFYLAIAYASAFPRVSAEYRAHFLQRRADCWLPDAASRPPPPAAVSLGGLAYPQACRYLRFRWYEPDPWGVWAWPGTATLRLPWRQGADAVRLLLLGPPGPAPVQIALSSGPHHAEATLAPGQTRAVDLELPPTPDHAAWEISVRTIGHGTAPRPDPAVPTRAVGIGLERLTYLPLEPPPRSRSEAK